MMVPRTVQTTPRLIRAHGQGISGDHSYPKSQAASLSNSRTMPPNPQAQITHRKIDGTATNLISTPG